MSQTSSDLQSFSRDVRGRADRRNSAGGLSPLAIGGGLILLLMLATQLSLGANILTLTFLLIGAAVSFGPMVLRGVNLFTLVPAIFFIRYEGLAFFAKTFLLQSLDSNLHFPVESYGFTAIILAAVTIAASLAALLAPRRVLLPKIQSADQLRVIGFIATGIGLTGALASALTANRTAGVGNTGISVIFFMLGQFPILGLVCEASFTHQRTKGRTLFSLPLFAIFGANVLVGLLNNSRGVIADAATAIVVMLILFRQFKLRYLMIGAIGALVFQGFVSPVLLASRYYKQTGNMQAFIVGTADTALHAATDFEYLTSLSRDESVGHRDEGLLFDYYANQSNILNRLSWVALVDQVYSGSRGHELLGTAVLPEIFGPLVPRFIYPDKPVQRFVYSDWLSFHYGFEGTGHYSALSFGLPMEGLVTIGEIGFFVYPLLAIFPMLLMVAWISGWRQSGPFAIFFFVSMQTTMVEFQTDGFLNFYLRFLPVTTLVIYAVYRAALVIHFGRSSIAVEQKLQPRQLRTTSAS